MKIIGLLCVGVLLATSELQAWETIDLQPSQDNTLYESAIDSGENTFELSNGAGAFLFAGRTGEDAGFRLRRALLQFDLHSALPAGARIIAARLRIYQSKAAPGSPPADMGLHRVLQAWGEGMTDAPGAEGQGNFAENGDATWHHRIFPDELWNEAGGSFDPAPSAVVTVGQLLQHYEWICTQEMLADLQTWVDSPAINFGWIMVGGEIAGTSAHRFGSRENITGEERPRLSLFYRSGEVVFDDSFEDFPACE